MEIASERHVATSLLGGDRDHARLQRDLKLCRAGFRVRLIRVVRVTAALVLSDLTAAVALVCAAL